MPPVLPSLLDIFAGVHDPRQPCKVLHPLAEVLSVATCGVLIGADTFEEIAAWAGEKLPWLRQFLSLPNGVPSPLPGCSA